MIIKVIKNSVTTFLKFFFKFSLSIDPGTPFIQFLIFFEEDF